MLVWQPGSPSWAFDRGQSWAHSIQRSLGMVTIMVWDKGEERQVSLGPSHPVSAWNYKYNL